MNRIKNLCSESSLIQSAVFIQQPEANGQQSTDQLALRVWLFTFERGKALRINISRQIEIYIPIAKRATAENNRNNNSDNNNNSLVTIWVVLRLMPLYVVCEPLSSLCVLATRTAAHTHMHTRL